MPARPLERLTQNDSYESLEVQSLPEISPEVCLKCKFPLKFPIIHTLGEISGKILGEMGRLQVKF